MRVARDVCGELFLLTKSKVEPELVSVLVLVSAEVIQREEREERGQRGKRGTREGREGSEGREAREEREERDEREEREEREEMEEMEEMEVAPELNTNTKPTPAKI